MSNEMIQNMGAQLVGRANEMIVSDQMTYGDPSSLISREAAQIQVTLMNAGLLKEGARIEPRHVVAIKAGFAVVGLTSAADPSEALARYIATGVSGSPIVAFRQQRDEEKRHQAAPQQRVEDQSHGSEEGEAHAAA